MLLVVTLTTMMPRMNKKIATVALLRAVSVSFVASANLASSRGNRRRRYKLPSSLL